jgi:hypothetical protein
VTELKHEILKQQTSQKDEFFLLLKDHKSVRELTKDETS